MAKRPFSMGSVVLVSLLLLALLPLPAAAFGAGNIPSIAQIEGLNFRHGGEIPTELDSLSLTRVADIEDMLKTIAFIKGHKWTTMMVKRVYFGNWLREYVHLPTCILLSSKLPVHCRAFPFLIFLFYVH
jgi:hypothetical protein